jgi:hypothetical protein
VHVNAATGSWKLTAQEVAEVGELIGG